MWFLSINQQLTPIIYNKIAVNHLLLSSQKWLDEHRVRPQTSFRIIPEFLYARMRVQLVLPHYRLANEFCFLTVLPGRPFYQPCYVEQASDKCHGSRLHRTSWLCMGCHYVETVDLVSTPDNPFHVITNVLNHGLLRVSSQLFETSWITSSLCGYKRAGIRIQLDDVLYLWCIHIFG